jgi:hypothetical protein
MYYVEIASHATSLYEDMEISVYELRGWAVSQVDFDILRKEYIHQ